MSMIDREEAIRWVQTECNPYGKPTLDYDSGVKVIEHLEKMRPAEKRGHWCGGEICSVCGVSKYNWFTVVSEKSAPFGFWRFCPGCGADMREEKKDGNKSKTVPVL